MIGQKQFRRTVRLRLEALEDRTVPSGSPPVANAGGPYTISEGQSLTLNASGSSDPDNDTLTYAWDTDNDGLFDEAVGVTPTLSWSELPQDGPTTRDIRVQVSDGTNTTISSPTTLTVLNAPPQVTIIPTYIQIPIRVIGPDGFPALALQTTIQLFASPFDPSPVDQAAGFTNHVWSVSFNGGPPTTSGGPSVYLTTPGSYTVSVQASDKDGGVGTGIGSFRIDPPVVPGLPAPTQVVLAVGAGAGAASHVQVYSRTGELRHSFLAFDPAFTGGVRVGVGNVNGSQLDDVIVGAGPGATGGHVKVFDGVTGAEIRSFMAFPGFNGGVTVAADDMNNDGFADIIVGAGPGASGGHVKVFDGRTGAEIRSFLAFPGFAGGVTVAGGDVNSAGADIIVGAGAGSSGGHVKVFDGQTGALIRSFFAFDAQFMGGVNVAAGDLNGDGFADLIVGAESTPHVEAFDGQTGAVLRSFMAFPGFAGGARVAATDLDGDRFSDIVVGAGAGAGPHIMGFASSTQSAALSFHAFDPLFSGGVFVG